MSICEQQFDHLGESHLRIHEREGVLSVERMDTLFCELTDQQQRDVFGCP